MSKRIEELVLTADQIEQSDNMVADIAANESTLKIALNFHTNRVAEMEKRNRKFFDGIANAMGLDLDAESRDGRRIRVSMVNGAVKAQLVEIAK